MMNYRLQLSPIFGTHPSRMDLSLPERPEGPIINLEETKLFRSWLIYDSAQEFRHESCRPDWNLVTGLTLAVAVSIGCWVGLGYAVASIWK